MITLTLIRQFKAPHDGYVTADLRTYKKGMPLNSYAFVRKLLPQVELPLFYRGPFCWITNAEFYTYLTRCGVSSEQASRMASYNPVPKSFTSHVNTVAPTFPAPYRASVSATSATNQTNKIAETDPNIMAKKAKTKAIPAASAPAPEAATPPPPPSATTATPPPPPVVGNAPAPAVPPVVAPAAPAAPAVAKEEKNGVTKPTEGTTTRNVWDTADKITATKGTPATRKEVVEACVAQGTNSSTATTQFGKWAKFHGLTGDNSPGRAPAAPAPATGAPAPAPAVSEADTAGYTGYKRAAAGDQVGNPYAEGSPEAAQFLTGWNRAHAEASAA